jgi:hypothetical protein
MSRVASCSGGYLAWWSHRHGGRSGLGLAAVAGDRSSEGAHDHGEPDLELIAEVVAGAQDVLGRHLGEVGYSPANCCMIASVAHEGRHAAVSIMSSNGVRIKGISDTVGRKSTHVTGTIYRHVNVAG